MVHQWQQLFYQERYSQTLLADNPDFVKLAEAYAWQAERVSDPGEVEAAMGRLLATEGPALLDLRIGCDENVYPMVAPGAPIDEIIGAVNVGSIAEMIDEKGGGGAGASAGNVSAGTIAPESNAKPKGGAQK
jgi:acetolactate synthase-1/2/3 large subunit